MVLVCSIASSLKFDDRLAFDLASFSVPKASQEHLCDRSARMCARAVALVLGGVVSLPDF